MSSEALSERELGGIENEISAVLKEENEEADWKFRTQVIGEFALNLIEDFRRSKSEASRQAAELQERVENLEGVLARLENFLELTATYAVSKPKRGYAEFTLKTLREDLSRSAAKQKNQEEE